MDIVENIIMSSSLTWGLKTSCITCHLHCAATQNLSKARSSSKDIEIIWWPISLLYPPVSIDSVCILYVQYRFQYSTYYIYYWFIICICIYMYLSCIIMYLCVLFVECDFRRLIFFRSDKIVWHTDPRNRWSRPNEWRRSKNENSRLYTSLMSASRRVRKSNA